MLNGVIIIYAYATTLLTTVCLRKLALGTVFLLQCFPGAFLNLKTVFLQNGRKPVLRF